MKTAHPHTFEIEINRNEFERLEAGGNRLICLFILFFPALMIWAVCLNRLEDSIDHPWHPFAWSMLIALGLFVCGWGISWIFHFTFGRKIAQRISERYRVTVEGPFLRIISGHLDRKMHFRDIHDYTADSSRHRKCPGVMTILMNASAVKANVAGIKIPAVKNGLEIRDLLAEIDAERE